MPPGGPSNAMTSRRTSTRKMSTMESIVGTWDVRVIWQRGLGAGLELNAPDVTFNADGTWGTTGTSHRGWWLQYGDLAIWLDSVNPGVSPGVVWSADIEQGPLVPHDLSMAGIMSWLEPGNLGTFRARRLF